MSASLVEPGDTIVYAGGTQTFVVDRRKLSVNSGGVFLDAAGNVFVVASKDASVTIQIP